MSNMVVKTNVLALNSHRALKQVGVDQSKASKRLSTGFRINSAADDAAGLAISEKMRAQIRGLDMASKNSQDAISLIQTAEGGMQEIDNMLQRIRELTVQASNDTNEHNEVGTGDRQKMQDEINQLTAEIDSMAERVEFNKKRVINGEFDDPRANSDTLNKLHADKSAALTKATTNEISATKAYDDAVLDKNAALTNLTTARDDQTTASNAFYGSALLAEKNRVDALEPTYLQSLDKASAANNTYISARDAVNAKQATTYGVAAENLNAAGLAAVSAALTKIETSTKKMDTPAEVKTALEETQTSINAYKGGDYYIAGVDLTGKSVKTFSAVPTDAEIQAYMSELTSIRDVDAAGDVVASAFLNTAIEQGNAALAALDYYAESQVATNLGTEILAFDTADSAALKTLSDAYAGAVTTYNNAEDAFRNTDSVIKASGAGKKSATDTKANAQKGYDAINDKLNQRKASADALNAAGLDAGLFFQVGSNANQGLQMTIGSIKSDTLGIGDGSGGSTIDLLKYTGASITDTLDVLDNALSYVTTERSKLGAAQNRLEYTIKSLDISSENLSASESRIRDADMAKEMMNLTQANVLQQAATSMLAQANQAPQSILQLLG